MTLITTLIPTYRRPHLLERAIQSVLDQTFDNFLICVYDNASNDETGEVVKKMQKKDSRISYFCHQKNIGILENFSYALEQVQTPYFSFLSDDDFLLPWFFEVALESFSKNPHMGFSAFRTLVINSKGKILPFQLIKPFINGYFPSIKGLANLIKDDKIIWTSILFKSDVLPSLKCLNKNVGTLFDLDLIYRYAIHYPFIFNKKPCALFFGASAPLANVSSVWPNQHQLVQNILQELNIQKIPQDTIPEFQALINKKTSLKVFINFLSLKNLKQARALHVLLVQRGEALQKNLFSRMIKLFEILIFLRPLLRLLLYLMRQFRHFYYLSLAKFYTKNDEDLAQFLVINKRKKFTNYIKSSRNSYSRNY